MNVLFLEYPKCSTCQNAKKWLESHNIDFDNRHIKEQNPTASELTQWIARSKEPVKKFFNTSGLVYKSLQLKDKLPEMDQAAQIELLATNGMLVKRPLIIGEDFVLIGFREDEWEKRLG